ncbi:alcohol dehydrogenase catalytic domain-containing protein [Natrinema gelatinilyticum]|uniref:alcohol dehydrogenase catalytic domain-containing protein n=1 Tax=Natrinema gelatinilyticum TaxID=2961571 RepID=UPI0020C454F6|nr:alcohol dehydrogenase catalytic domain-containing protein [Natrinema gelatinilyticum]
MKAVGFHEHGPLSNYDLLTVPTPEVDDDEVLVDVKASALNYMDLFAVRELDHYVPQYPFWGGGDVAGVVAEVGANVTRWSEGDRVVAVPFISCGDCRFCVRGEEMLCEEFTMMGEMRRGGHAEYVAMPEKNLIPIPDDTGFVTAASVPVAGGTAWRALVPRAAVQPTEDVLVVGATGGVGTFSVQICKNVLNVDTLYATTSSEEKAEFLRDLGVDYVVNYTEERFDEAIWELTDKQGVDVCYNNVGGDTWVKSMRTLRWGGRLVTSGATVGPNPATEIRQLFMRQLDVVGSSGANSYELAELYEYVWSGDVEPVIDDTFPLEEYMTAFERMDDRKLYGKVVLTQE